MKILSALICAILFAVLGPATNASAQIYVVCNNSPVAVAVCLQVNCGGAIGNLAPCPAVIAPGQCFTWSVPAACVVMGTRVNGVLYPVPAAFPFCYPVAAPPPTWVCYSGGAAVVQVNIQ